MKNKFGIPLVLGTLLIIAIVTMACMQAPVGFEASKQIDTVASTSKIFVITPGGYDNISFFAFTYKGCDWYISTDGKCLVHSPHVS